MKKVLALVLCLMLALSVSAMAEAAPSSLAISISEIELNVGEAIVVNPSLTLAFGSEGESAWGELSALIGGEKVIAAEFEVETGTISFTVDGANDVLKITGADEMLSAQAGMSTSELISTLNDSFAQMGSSEALAATLEALPSMLDGLSVEKLGELDYKFSYTEAESGISASLRLTIALGTEKAFDLSGKNVVEVAADAETVPETDVVTVAQEKLGVLMADESVATLITLFTAITGATASTSAA